MSIHKSNLELLKRYLSSCPFDGNLHFNYFAELDDLNSLIDFDDFNFWFIQNRNSEDITNLLSTLEEVIKINLQNEYAKFENERNTAKLRFPTLEAVYTRIGMYDN